ncbi:MAG: serine/threonine protein kinase, partial [Planctomycetes bacterium]|nr:serine/threonine protein kinase [Planctomycetota bacterium]
MLKFAIVLCICIQGNWPQFRGPNSNGHANEHKPPMQWSDTENVVWKAPLPGLGWSSPVIVDEKIYL